MPRIAFKMKLNPGCRDEYIKRHAAIWPELKALLSENGISDYSIFLDEETYTLFGVQMQESRSSQDLAAAAVMRKWWAYMADIMETNDDLSPVSAPLTEVFHMD